MAGHFPLALRNALMTGAFDLSRVQRTALMTHAPGTANAFDPRVKDWGQTTLRAMNVDPRSRGGLQFPELTIVCRNEDGFLTPGTALNAWQDTPPQEWIYTFTADYVVDGTPYRLTPHCEWSVVGLSIDGAEATITMIHRLARYWAKRFGDADRYTAQSAAVYG